jgi:glutamine amidotransferase-like uncharacterized protein
VRCCVRGIANIPKVPFLATLLLASAMVMSCGSHNPAVQKVILPPAIPAAEPVLLYVGAGTSDSDVSAVESVLGDLNIGYLTVDGPHLEGLTEAQLGGYKLIIVPGGNSITIGQNLSPAAVANVNTAVGGYGVHYLGICAGAFFGGWSSYNGVDLTSGVAFDFYADEYKGIHTESVQLSFPQMNSLEAYWQDGPQLSGWGNVVAKFPDGTPAIVEGNFGPGFVIFTGVHLEAPANWWTGPPFTNSLSQNISYAGTVIQAALSGTSLPHF